MSGIVQPRVRPVADLTLTAVMLVIFGWALWTSFDWSFRAALFPRMVTVWKLPRRAQQAHTTYLSAGRRVSLSSHFPFG